jgi:stearoyl-CoA desaturase (delta-9 desaturase)
LCGGFDRGRVLTCSIPDLDDYDARVHWLTAVILGVVLMQVATFATTVYMHRGLAHRALTVNPWVAVPLRAFLWMSTGMRPREWAAVHRRHHAALDTAEDPHSPLVLGVWRVQLTNAYLYQRAVRDREQIDRYARDITPDAWDRWFFDHDILGPLLGIALLCLVFGWETGLLAAAIHLFLYVAFNGMVNSFAHTVGRRPYENSGTNLRVLAVITMGEGLHNTHHALPTSARLSFSRGEVDLGWQGIRLLQRLKLAKVRHEDPSKLLERVG